MCIRDSANHVLYDLCYADQNTLYFPLNDYDHSQNMGIYIRIKILRKKGSNRMKNYIMRGLESLHESYLVRIPATASKKERLIGKIGKGIMKISGESEMCIRDRYCDDRIWTILKRIEMIIGYCMSSKRKEMCNGWLHPYTAKAT